MINRSRLAALFFILVSSVVVAPRELIHRSQQSAAPAPVVIPFEVNSRHILIKVRINDSAPLTFILDTGDKVAIVNLARATALNLNLQGQLNIGGAGAGTLKGSFVRDAALTVVGLEGNTEPVALAVPFKSLESRMGRVVDGIIGSDFMKKFVVEIDYPKHVLRLHDKDKFAYSGSGESIPLKLNSAGHAVIPAEFTVAGRAPVKGNFVVDIGSAGSFALHSPIVAAEHLPPAELKTIRALGGVGAGGKVTGRSGRIAALTIGQYRIEDPLTLFSSDTAGAFASDEQQGNIGQRILSKFKLYFDYAHNRLILEPNASFKAPISPVGAGLVLVAEGADYKTFRVDDVLEDSPATEAGLRKDDIILAVDALPAAELTMWVLHETFEQAAPHKVSVRRGTETLQLVLTPRKII
jgi:hypothetical protein